jgi:lactate dehydrogenase-like 2-hydroxyacid dehydrogenase
MPRVLVIDPLFPAEPDIERLALGAGFDIAEWRPGREAEPGAADLAGAEALLVCRSRVPITAEIVAKANALRLVVATGVGFNHIDLSACAARGIPVSNTPDYGTTEVADHAIALMLTLVRGTAASDHRLRGCEDGWGTDKIPLPPMRRLRGQVFGVVGLGRIGLAAALRAKGFGMDVRFFDPYLPPGAELAAGLSRAASLEALLASSDILSLHCPLTPETRGLMNAAAFAALKANAILLNTARGPVVELDALEASLRSGRLCAAGLDVVPDEPRYRGHPLIEAWAAREPWLNGRFLLTPHSAFYTPESLADMRRLSATAVAEFFATGHVRSLVNGAELAAAGYAAR